MCRETMLTSFRKSVHTLLGFPENPEEFLGPRNRYIRRNPSFDDRLSGGLSLIAAEVENPKNVLEASALKPTRKDAFSVPNLPEKPVPVILDCYNSGFGLQSCTESLGFESSDVIVKPLQDEDRRAQNDQVKERSRPQRSFRRRMVSKTEVKFPPPLSSMGKNGQRNYYLKPSRKDGRFMLTEMKIDRPEILRASRVDGRLRLQLVRQVESLRQGETHLQNKKQQEQEQEPDQEQEEQEKIIVSSGWRGKNFRLFPLKSEGSWRCYEQSNHLPFCNARCVATS